MTLVGKNLTEQATVYNLRAKNEGHLPATGSQTASVVRGCKRFLPLALLSLTPDLLKYLLPYSFSSDKVLFNAHSPMYFVYTEN